MKTRKKKMHPSTEQIQTASNTYIQVLLISQMIVLYLSNQAHQMHKKPTTLLPRIWNTHTSVLFFFFHFLHLAFSFSKQVPSSLEGKKKKWEEKKCEARTRSHTLACAKKSAQCRLSTHTFTRAFCSHPLRMKGDGRVKKCSLRCLCPSPSCRSCACRRVFPIDRRPPDLFATMPPCCRSSSEWKTGYRRQKRSLLLVLWGFPSIFAEFFPPEQTLKS